MRATLLQIDVDMDEPVADRRERVAALVRAQAGADLVVLPELWPVGAFAADSFGPGAEPVAGGPTAAAMGAAAKAAGVWLHAGSIVERDTSGAAGAGPGGAAEGDRSPLYNTSLLFSPDGELRATYRKIHRFGFDRGEATLMSAGDRVVTARLPQTVLGLATCYDLRFPELFRLLVDAGAHLLVVPAGWPARRLAHWRLLVQARAVESQAYVLACGTAGTHAGVEQSGHSMVVDPWGEILGEAGAGEETLTVELDPARVAATRAEFPVLRDRVLGVPTP
ncbi:carbon-nitrogen family hydrolase [Streptomyces sp. NBC_01476]|uniref:carbon-nitrogen family hydrolase n=1 Tax=Streptomyces sp. NBC_01476 TaxID=2903881 RepID=UPI002E368218|nr:carbon-nitrogen family hydrolase [Streptomyces sp. NBC_01476]